MAFFNDFKGKLSGAAKAVGGKARSGMEIGRISGESRSVAVDLAHVYEQIGRIYVDSNGSDADSMAPLCEKALALRQKLDELDRQKLQLRSQNRCPACGALAAKEARFCPACGYPISESE